MTVTAAAREARERAAAPRMQRAEGAGRLSVKYLEGRTRIDRLYQQGCAKIRLPRVFSGDALEAVLINSSGGLTGGDRLDWELAGGPGTATVATTQACEKVYRSSGGQAEVATRISVAAGARFAWLPQETILFERASLSRRLDVDIAEGGEALIVEPVAFGRLAMGERPASGCFTDRWTVRHAGRLVHAECQRFGPDIGREIARPAVLGGRHAMATLLWIHPDAEEHVGKVRAVAGPEAGVSGWRTGDRRTGKILARIVAEDSYQLRKRLVPVIELLNGRAGLPKVWSI